MVELIHEGVYYKDGQLLTGSELAAQGIQADAGKGAKKTLAYQVLEAHQQGAGMEDLHLKFDALTSHDITYVGIIQTAIASGLDHFPIPYILTNCHNSLAAVGTSSIIGILTSYFSARASAAFAE